MPAELAESAFTQRSRAGQVRYFAEVASRLAPDLTSRAALDAELAQPGPPACMRPAQLATVPPGQWTSRPGYCATLTTPSTGRAGQARWPISAPRRTAPSTVSDQAGRSWCTSRRPGFSSSPPSGVLAAVEVGAAREAITLAREAAVQPFEVAAHSTLATVLVRLGEPEQGLAEHKLAQDLAGKAGDPAQQAEVLSDTS